jgi:hypothetical protein
VRLVRVAMICRMRVGVSGGRRSRDLAGPFRIIAGRRDPHLLVSLLHIRDAQAKLMPHRSTAVLAGYATGAPFGRLNYVRIWFAFGMHGLRGLMDLDCRDIASAVACGELKETGP